MFSHKNSLSPKFCFAISLLCLPLTATANGTLYGNKYGKSKSTPLVVGGAGSKLTLTPSVQTSLSGIESSDASWLKFSYLGASGVNSGLEVNIVADPDTADRSGYILVTSGYGRGSDTIYVLQPGSRCVDPKQGSMGSDFFVAFIENGEQNISLGSLYHVHLFLYATSDYDNTSVEVIDNATGSRVVSSAIPASYLNPAPSITNPITLKQNQVKPIYYTSGSSVANIQSKPAYNYQAETVTKKSLLVKASNPISLYAYNAEWATSEISYILPMDALGDEYFTVSYHGSYVNGVHMPEEVLIIATEDKTPVTITPADNTSTGKKAGDPFTILLNRGQTYLVKSKNRTNETIYVTPGLTGTHIKSGKPIAVFGGNKRAGMVCPKTVSGSNHSRDHLFEQMLPLTSWGKRYALVQTEQRSNPYRIVAACDNTTVTVTSGSNVESITLHRGQFAERRIIEGSSHYAYIEATQPVTVALFAESNNCWYTDAEGESIAGDPFLIVLGAADKGISNATFAPIKLIAPESGVNSAPHEHYVTAIVETLYKGYTKLTWTTTGISDSLSLTFHDMPNTPYSYATYKLTYNPNYNYQLSNPYGFTAYGYGYGYREAYGYLLGAQLGKSMEEGSDIAVGDIARCHGDPPTQLPQCIDGADGCLYVAGDTEAQKKEKDKKKYYWYNSLNEWRDDKPLATAPVVTTDHDTTYTLFVSKMERCGVSYPQQITVEVLPLPEVTFRNDTVCLSAPSTNDYGGRPSGGKYTYAGGQPFAHATAGVGSHAVTYTYTNERGCIASKTATITVETLDRDPFIRIAIGDASLCDGDEVVLEVAKANKNRTFQWYHADTLIAGSTSSRYTIAPGASVYANGKYSAHVYNANGCMTIVDTTVTIYARPEQPNISTYNSTAACAGVSYTLYDDAYVVDDIYSHYQWYKTSLNAANKIAGAIGYSYTAENDTIAGIRHFVLGAVNPIPGRPLENGCWSYAEFDITVYPSASAPQIFPQGDQEVCSGDSLKLTATALNEDGYTYMWYSINQDASISLLPSLSSQIYVKEGKYLVESISRFGCKSKARSSTTTVEVRDKPGTPIITGGSPACAGDTIFITAVAAVPPSSDTAYQWYAVSQNGAYTEISNATGAIYGVTESGRYTVLAKSRHSKVTCSSAYSQPADVSLWPQPLPPVVTGQTNVCIGNNNVDLTASPAPGSIPIASYRWYKKGEPITAAINNAITLTQTDSAVKYAVVAISANGCRSKPSNEREVILHRPTVSIKNGADRNECFGKTVTLEAQTNAGVGCTYDWYKNDAALGSNQSSYVVYGDPAADQKGYYSLYVTDAYGCTSPKSNEVMVSIYITTSNFSIASSPACAGNELVLTATTSGASTYRWYFEANGAFDSIAQTNDAKYTIASAQTSNAGRYKARITATNGCISEGFGEAVVHSLPQTPTITPAALHFCDGDSVRLVAYSGTKASAYGWTFYSGNVPEPVTPASGTQIYARQEGGYSVQVKSAQGCWSEESKKVELYAHRKPERPTISPADNPITVCVSGATTITAYAQGATSYRWYSVNEYAGIYTDLSSYSHRYGVTQSGDYAARAYISYAYGTDSLTCPSDSFSAPKKATLHPVPAAPTIRGNASACAGETVTLIAAPAPGDVIASYRWHKGGVPIYGTASDTCLVTQIEDAYYTVAAISDKGCASAASVTQKVSIRRPTVSIANNDTTICYGNAVTLKANTNTGSNSHYKWYENDKLILNADARNYVIQSSGNPLVSKTAKYKLYVVDEGGCESANPSNVVTVTTGELPPPPEIPTPPAVCEGNSVTLAVGPSGKGAYRWYFEKNGAPALIEGTGNNDTSYLIPNIQVASAGRYMAEITNGYGCTSKAWVTVEVYALPRDPIFDSADTLHRCTGDSAQLVAYAADGDQYEWYFNGGKLPSFGNRIYAGMTGSYSVWSISKHKCKSQGSDAVAVAIHSRPEKPTIFPEGHISVCANGSLTITGSAAGATSYQWYTVDPATSKNTIINGATGSDYAVGKSGHYAVRADILYGGSGSSYQLTCPSTSNPKEVELLPVLLPPVVTGEKTPEGGEKTSGCDGEILTLTAAVPGNPNVASYKWFKNGTEMTSTTTSTYTITQVDTAEYKVEALSDKGCRSEASTSKRVEIRNRPTVTIADGVREVCGGTITLSAVTDPPATGGTYDWRENGVPIPEASTSPLYVVKGNSNTTASKRASCYLYVTDRYGCTSFSPSNTVEVNIRGLPPTPAVTVEQPLPNGVCVGDNATLQVSPSGAGIYKWFKRNGRSFDSIAVTSDTAYRIFSAQTSDAGQYAVEIINTYGCTSTLRGEAELNVLGLPVVNIIETRACENWTEENTVNFAEPEGGKFTCWGCTDDGKFIPAKVRQGTVSLTYTYEGQNRCRNSDTKTIEIIRLPNTPIVTAEGPTAVCEDNIFVKLQANVAVTPGYEYASSYTYQWRKDKFALSGEDSIAYVATKAGSYDVIVCNQGLCWAASPSAPVEVSVIPLPAPPVIATQSAFMCPGASTELFVQQSEGGSFQWYKGDSKKMNKIAGEIATTYNANEIGQYAVELFGENGCWSELSNLITVGEHSLPKQPEIIPSQANLYAGMDYTLTVKTPQTGEQYEWYKNNLSIDLTSITFPIHNLGGNDTGRYTVKAVNEHGCSTWSDAYALAWSEGKLFVPKIFTPNGDGINDYFQILGLEEFVENKLEIFNKRGIVIFSQKNYLNEWNGRGLPNDIYYYTLELKRENGAASILHGYVHLKQ
jgi:gliding motility-associated-like protein